MAQELLGPAADTLARLHTAEALGGLVSVLRNPGSKPADVINAANSLLDRGHGKPTQAIITIPARRALGARLAALDDAALLAIASARRGAGTGGTPQSGGPNAQGTPRVPYSALQGSFQEAPGSFHRAPDTRGSVPQDVPRGTTHAATQQRQDPPLFERFDEDAHFQKLFAISRWPPDHTSQLVGSPEPLSELAFSPLAIDTRTVLTAKLPFGLQPHEVQNQPEVQPPDPATTDGGVPPETGDPSITQAAGPHEFRSYDTHGNEIDPLA